MAIIDSHFLFMLSALLSLVCCKEECQPKEADGIYNDLSSCSYIHFRNITEFRLKEGIAISNQIDFQIIGNALNKTKIYCSNTSGVTLNNVTDIIFKNIEFYGCGEWHFYSNESVTAAIWMLNCINIYISNTFFYGSHGTALVLINTSGFVQITNSIFHSSGINEWEEMSANGGGGLYIQQTQASNASVNVSVINCDFIENHAAGTCHSTTCDDTECTFSYGGGLAISLQNPSAGIFVSINRCNFQNNSAIAGGGMEIAICSSRQSVIEFENVTFSDNEASEEGGGALDIIWHEQSKSSNQISLTNVRFLRNHALYGGGIAIGINTELNSNSILLVGCLWQENIAHHGSAINLFPENTVNGWGVVNISISDSNFINNSNCNKPDNKAGLFQQGIGIIKIVDYKISFLGNIKFVNNSGSCVYAIGSEIHFQGANISFNSNMAEYGSGISLVGLSKITTNHACHLTFIDNYARRECPTIYYSPADSRQILKTNRYSPDILFSLNGSASFQNCGNFIPKDKRYFDDNHVENLTVLNKIHFSPCISHSNHTPTPAIPRMCKSSENITSNILYFIPGIEKELNLVKYHASFLVTLNHRSSHSITLPEIYGHITDKLVLQGEPGKTAEVTLHDTDFNGLHMTFRAKLTACPVLYELSNDNKCTCVSASDIHFHSSFRCNVTGYMSYSSISSGYWIGIEMSSDYNESITLMGRCPIGFCNTNQSWIELPYTNTTTNSAAIDKVLCNRRQGRLCGTCANGTVVYVHSRTYKCGGMDLCHWGWVFFLSAEILPLTAFFSGVVFFRVKLTAGGVSGFIFFAQMCVYMNNKLETSNYTIPYQYTAFHHFVYQLFNLEFAEFDSLSFCFSNQLRNLDVLLVKYAVSLYCFSLIVLTVALAKFSQRFKLAKWMISSKRSIVQTLSTFIIMVYSKCTYTNFSILWYQQLYNGTKPTRKVVSLQGELDYFSPQHLPYAVPAILVLVLFTIPLPLILLLYPLSNKVIAKLGLGETRVVGTISKMLPLSKLLPLLDCFQGSFKDRYRFFSGLYFTYRIIVLSTLTTLAVSRSYLIVTILVTAMLVVHTLAWPYKKKIHNAIDALLFGNLAIISGLKAFIIILEGNASLCEIRVTHAVEIVLTNLPIAVIAAYFVARACIAAKKLGKKSTISQVALNNFFLSDDIRQENLDKYQLMTYSQT